MEIQNKYTAVIKREGDWYIGWVEEIPGANAQEQTKSELIVSLQEAARDIFEIRRQDAIKQAKSNYEEVSLFI